VNMPRKHFFCLVSAVLLPSFILWATGFAQSNQSTSSGEHTASEDRTIRPKRPKGEGAFLSMPESFPRMSPEGGHWVPSHYEVIDGVKKWVPEHYEAIGEETTKQPPVTSPQLTPPQQERDSKLDKPDQALPRPYFAGGIEVMSDRWRWIPGHYAIKAGQNVWIRGHYIDEKGTTFVPPTDMLQEVDHTPGEDKKPSAEMELQAEP
jgi:hypothetical protein